MKPQSMLAIYVLFWTMSLFLVLPWGVRTSEELGEARQPGHADSAPHFPNLWRKALWTTVVSGVLFALFYANYRMGWLTAESFPQFHPPVSTR